MTAELDGNKKSHDPECVLSESHRHNLNDPKRNKRLVIHRCIQLMNITKLSQENQQPKKVEFLKKILL